jgi:hypothetical protein
MFTTKVQIGFPTHKASVTVDLEHIRVFKYNDRVCDFAIFDHIEQSQASDYLLEPLSDRWYKVTFPGEDPNQPPY